MNDPLSWPLQEPGSGQVGGLDVHHQNDALN